MKEIIKKVFALLVDADLNPFSYFDNGDVIFQVNSKYFTEIVIGDKTVVHGLYPLQLTALCDQYVEHREDEDGVLQTFVFDLPAPEVVRRLLSI